MPDIQINLLAVLACVVVGFFFSYAWYTPLFGKAWANEMGFDHDEPMPGGQLARGLIMTVVGVLLISFVQANTMAAWHPASWGVTVATPSPPYENALQAAFFTWLGYFVPVHLSGVAWARRSWKLFAIDAGYHLVLLLIVSFILAYAGR
jgi:Protein of unknown function (DUF1761)